MEDFKLEKVNGTIVLGEDNNFFAISKTSDGDIWFSTSQDDFSIVLNSSSRDHKKWQTYLIFENLMKLVFGRYVLDGDYYDKYSKLPKDFIDLENRTIIWHSDSGIDNVLMFQVIDDTIKISISKSKGIKDWETNAVRIRTSGSCYKYYCQEFIQFFNQLTVLERKLNTPDQISKKKTIVY